MSFKVEPQDKYSLVTVGVEKLDGAISPELKSQLVMINSDGGKNIIVDMSQTRYCDSSGLSAILVGNRLCKNEKGSFVLCGIQEPVMKLIAISQLDTILSITPSLTEAVDLVYMEEVEREVESED